MEWFTKKNGHAPKCAIYIAKTKINSMDYISIRFTLDTLKEITRTNYIKLAIDGTRVYFDEADSKNGWRVGTPKESKCGYMRIKADERFASDIEEGSYELEFDKYNGYHYIDSDNKLEKTKIIWRNR